MSKYRIISGDNVICTFSGNFSQASSPLFLDGNSTPFQVADARHSSARAAQLLLDWCEGQGGDLLDGASYEVVEVDEELEEVVRVLKSHGDTFSGGVEQAEAYAKDWIEEGFGAEEVEEWCEEGFWDPATAAALRDENISPREAKRAANKLIDACDDPAEEYTDGCPIYAACNGDIGVQVLIDAVREEEWE